MFWVRHQVFIASESNHDNSCYISEQHIVIKKILSKYSGPTEGGWAQRPARQSVARPTENARSHFNEGEANPPRRDTYMLKVSRILVSRSEMKTLVMLAMKFASVMRPSLLESNILKNLSLIMPGKLQYSMKVTLSSFFS